MTSREGTNTTPKGVTKMKLTRDKRTGDYYTTDKKYFIEKGVIGWNVSIRDDRRTNIYGFDYYEYSFSCDTLKEVRESIIHRLTSL